MGAYYPETYHFDFTRFTRSSLADGSFLLSEELTQGSSFQRHQFWLHLKNAQCAGFIETVIYPRPAASLVLAAIEIRPMYRGAGLAQDLVKAVEDYFSQPMYTQGDFTPKGKRSLDFMPLVPEEYLKFTPKNKLKDMAFVKDWTLLIAKH